MLLDKIIFMRNSVVLLIVSIILLIAAFLFLYMGFLYFDQSLTNIFLISLGYATLMLGAYTAFNEIKEIKNEKKKF